ncbi:LytR C-terminal domain-containing protein [Pilimelia columellifera]|uniref:LytR/CpsA/Psr regulator C-terminal domain-containing protein n=1 Tax=Pilimelia columellifera subsp. columellifera TaxID=706583 RepID=A0ABN3N378_9ACTN
MSFARVRALAVVAILAVSAVIFVTIALVRDRQSGAAADQGCPEGWPRADLELPVPEQVKIRVYNGTAIPGLGEQVATDFANRKFQVDKKVATASKKFSGVALLRYGPGGVGSAHLLRAYFLTASRSYDPKIKGRLVEVTVGEDFQKLGTTTEVNQSIAILGEPPLPDRACELPKAKRP